MSLELPPDVDARIDRLPVSIRKRVEREFLPQDRQSVCQQLAAYGVEAHERNVEGILEEILNHANGNFASIEPLVLTAKRDWRDLFYSSHNDPYHLIGKLLKNLRFTKVFSDEEIVAVKGESGGIRYERTFDAILRMIQDSRKSITEKQVARIVQIGELLGYPTHAFEWLKNFLGDVDGVHRANISQKAWWKFW